MTALSSLTLPSSSVYIVQGGASPFAIRFAVSFTPGLDNRRLRHVLNLTGLSVSTGAPNAMFPGVYCTSHLPSGFSRICHADSAGLSAKPGQARWTRDSQECQARRCGTSGLGSTSRPSWSHFDFSMQLCIFESILVRLNHSLS